MRYSDLKITFLLIVLLIACFVSCEERTFKNRHDSTPKLTLEIRLADVVLEYPDSGKMAENYELHDEVLLGNSDIKCTEVREVMGYLGKKEHIVIVKLDEEGTRKFAEITENNIGRKLAILIEGEVISVPVILESVFDGRFELQEGYAGLEEARALAKGLVGR